MLKTDVQSVRLKTPVYKSGVEAVRNAHLFNRIYSLNTLIICLIHMRSDHSYVVNTMPLPTVMLHGSQTGQISAPTGKITMWNENRIRSDLSLASCQMHASAYPDISSMSIWLAFFSSRKRHSVWLAVVHWSISIVIWVTGQQTWFPRQANYRALNATWVSD